MQASDSGSGVNKTYYQVDNGAQLPYASGFQVSGAGSHAVRYWSTDNAGNTEPTHLGYVNIDISPPFTAATGFPSGAVNVPLAIALSATDSGGSGVDKTYYTVNGGTQTRYTAPLQLSADGAYAVEYWSVDKAGNTESAQGGTVTINSQAPTTIASGLHTGTSNGWSAVPQRITLIAMGGQAPVTTYYTIDGGAQQIYSSPFTVDSTGSHTFTYWSVDSLQNEEAHHTGVVNIDTIAPTIASDADAKWHKSAVIVHLSAADAGGSGLAATQYRLQGSDSWLTAVGDAFTVRTAGVSVCEFRALDGAGNESSLGSCMVRIDTSRPRTEAPFAAGVRRFAKVTLKFKVLDTGTSGGSATVTLKVRTLKGKSVKTLVLKNRKVNSLQSCRFHCTLKAGTYRFYVYATDAAGNVQSKVAHNTLRVR